MPLKPLCAAALVLCAAVASQAQQPAAQPLQAMPYTPSLDPASLDRSVEPCTDFYKFTCGGWMAHNPIPADQAGWSVYAKLAQRQPAVPLGHPRRRRQGHESHARAAEGR